MDIGKKTRLLKAIRTRLTAYGCDSSEETILQALDRLISEHSNAMDRVVEAEIERDQAVRDRDQARVTRDGAQNLATRQTTIARDAERRCSVLQNALDLLLPLLPPASQCQITQLVTVDTREVEPLVVNVDLQAVVSKDQLDLDEID